MATPSAARPHSGSTPKNASIATPTPMLPSPRPPTSAAMARNLSHKSPATKTPASGHGHSHNVSTSSHPSSTPLAATALGEDSLNFNSPAAIMMSSLGSHGMTPLPSGGDGLGISTDFTTVSAGRGSVPGTRNAEEDKLRRLQEVVKLLRSSVAGRGICREGVERLAQLAGFTHMWQSDTLAIAGTCVDLEITFDGTDRDKAKDVVLKIFTPEAEEHKKDASEVLKSNLEQMASSATQEPWRNLEGFAASLEHLSRMDHLSQGINCFEAIDGLYQTFRKIWEGEKERMGQRQKFDHLSRGIVGRPVLNRKANLGLSVEYWAERRQLPNTKLDLAEGEAMEIDRPRSVSEPDEYCAGLWTAKIGCETGYPSLRVSREWIAEGMWEGATNGDEATDDVPTPRIAWTEPPPTLIRPADNANDPNDIDLEDAEIKIPKPPQVRFVINLEPSVLVPLSVASTVLNRQGLSVALDESKFTTFDQALRHTSGSADFSHKPPIQRWNKSLHTFDASGNALTHRHSYSLYSSPQIWCYPVQSVTFDHPKHLADLLPIIRQYVLLWTLLHSIVSTESTTGRKVVEVAEKPAGVPGAQNMKGSTNRGFIKKSNMNPRRAKVNVLLGARGHSAAVEGASLPCSSPGSKPALPVPIDVSLSLASSTPSRPKLDLIWPLAAKMDKSTSSPNATFGSVSIEIGPNGEIVVPSTSGIPWAESEKGLRAIAGVVELGEDLSLLVEWIMEKLNT
jgi:hypothetical protein